MLASRPESRSPLGAALGMGHGPRGTPSSGPLRPPQRPHGARAQREPEVLPGEEMAENQLGTDPLRPILTVRSNENEKFCSIRFRMSTGARRLTLPTETIIDSKMVFGCNAP